ncbi:hypothetical protein V8C40DRAFT_212136 [Trichoderma camerunense]
MYSGLPSALRFAFCLALALPYLTYLLRTLLPIQTLSSSPSPFPPRLRCSVCSLLFYSAWSFFIRWLPAQNIRTHTLSHTLTHATT